MPQLALALTIAAGIAAVLAQLQQARRDAPAATVLSARRTPAASASPDDAAVGRIPTGTSGAVVNRSHPDIRHRTVHDESDRDDARPSRADEAAMGRDPTELSGMFFHSGLHTKPSSNASGELV